MVRADHLEGATLTSQVADVERALRLWGRLVDERAAWQAWSYRRVAKAAPRTTEATSRLVPEQSAKSAVVWCFA